MKRYLKLLSIFLVILAFGISGCKSKAVSTAPEAPQVVNNSGGNTGSGYTDSSGVSSTPGIEVKEGRIVVNITSGKISINGENVTLTVQDGGQWKLADGVNITIKDENGNTVNGQIYVDPETGILYFIPAAALDAGKTYTITVSVNGKTYTATVLLAVDNTCESNSLFAPVEIRNKGTYKVSALILNGKSIFGWEFGAGTEKFAISFAKLETGAKIYFTAFGTYDIENHRCEVYYQRWSGTGKIVKDEEWVYSSVSINADDDSIDGPNGNPDYSFKKTYLQIKIVDANGNDITSTSNAELIIK